MSQKVRVRIAPSPTGFAHVGTAYTALFNYAFARSQEGTFIIRVDDTDVNRNIEGAVEAIFAGLSWLNISWDESVDRPGKLGPYRQSEKLKRYKAIAQDFVKEGKAYEDDGAIRFRNPGVDVSWIDLVHGEVTFPADQITDFVIIKSDGYPTYNFASAVDDMDLRITHVIRGEEHISNTPRQIVIFEALGAKHPFYAHHPTLRNKDKKKLSKRRDPVNLAVYKEKGYLPEALNNFLCLLGWSHPDGKEIFSLKEFVDKFKLSDVRKAGPYFDLTKLDWINGEYIRQMDDETLSEKIFNFFEGKYSEQKVKEITPLIKTRIKTLKDFEDLAGFFFKHRKVDPAFFGKNYKKHLSAAAEVIESLDPWSKESLDRKLLDAVDKNGFKTGDFFMDLRVAVTGSRMTPPINDSIFILGQKDTLSRIRKI